MDNFTKNDYINNFLFNLNINWFNKIECIIFQLFEKDKNVPYDAIVVFVAANVYGKCKHATRGENDALRRLVRNP